MTSDFPLGRKGIVVWMLGLGVVLMATVAAAQSLDEVARRESDRRTRAESGRVYTNADLGAVEPPSSAPKPTVESAEPPTSPPAVEPVETDTTTIANFQSANGPSGKKDRNYWHTTAALLRARLTRTKADEAAQRDQLTEIAAAPQTPTVVRARDVISKTLTRLQRDVTSQELELTRFLTGAQLAKVPEEWFKE
jgi:hypothetical protein